MESSSKNELAEIASQLLAGNNTGALATVSVKHDGFPFASQSPYAVIEQQAAQSPQLGLPIFLFSDLSVHSKNLRSNPKATLLIQAGGEMQQGRVSLMGTVERLSEAQIEEARQNYLASHPDAAQWISFGDFNFYAMTIVDCYVVAGFGKAGWVKQ